MMEDSPLTHEPVDITYEEMLENYAFVRGMQEDSGLEWTEDDKAAFWGYEDPSHITGVDPDKLVE